MEGEINRVADCYLALRNGSGAEFAETKSFVVESVEVNSLSGNVIKTFDAVAIEITIRAKSPISDPGVYVGIFNSDDYRLAGVDFKDFGTHPSLSPGQTAQFIFTIENLPLLPGSYNLELHLKDMASYQVEFVTQMFSFDVVETAVYDTRKLTHWFGSVGLRVRAASNT